MHVRPPAGLLLLLLVIPTGCGAAPARTSTDDAPASADERGTPATNVEAPRRPDVRVGMVLAEDGSVRAATADEEHASLSRIAEPLVFGDLDGDGVEEAIASFTGIPRRDCTARVVVIGLDGGSATVRASTWGSGFDCGGWEEVVALAVDGSILHARVRRCREEEGCTDEDGTFVTEGARLTYRGPGSP